MRYSSGYRNASGAVDYFHAFAGNDMIDPDVTGAGHQPVNFDVLKAIYGFWNVRSSRMKLRITSNGTTFGATNARVTVCPQSVSTSLSSTGPLMQEQPGVKVFYVNSQTASRAIERNFYCHSSTKIREWSYKEPSCYGDATTSPSALWYWGIYIESIDDATNLSMAIECLIEYDVEWFERLTSYTN